MFRETNEKRKNQNRDENKVHISRDKNKKILIIIFFSFILTLKDIVILNRKRYETKNE